MNQELRRKEVRVEVSLRDLIPYLKSLVQQCEGGNKADIHGYVN